MDFKLQKFPELNKGLGQFPIPSNETGSWKIGDEDVSLPTACVVLPTVKHNIAWMAKYMKEHNMELCPHVKTTMCPKLIEMQVAGGVWGVTTATVQQVVVMHHIGMKRVLMANQLVGRRNMEIISAILETDSTFEFFCLVDSVNNVVELEEFFGAKKLKLNILVEIGMVGGRTGIRNGVTLAQTLQALKMASGTLVTRGVEFYEGVFPTEKEVREICNKAFEALMFLCLTFPGEDSLPDIIISGAGSAWFDIVAEEISSFPFASRKYIPVLRPGCCVVHDVGMYKETENRIREQTYDKVTLKPALKVIAYVQSRPEPNLVILGLGKRDVAIDCGFPKPCSFLVANKGGLSRNEKKNWEMCPTNWEVTKVMDQHTFLRVSENDALNEGDIVSLDISHPCNTFSLWRQILLVDESYTVLDIAPTYF